MTLFLKLYWKQLVLFGLVLILLWKVYAAGQDNRQRDWDADKAKDALLIAGLKTKQGTVTTRVETKYLTKTVTIREKADAIYKTREVFVPADSGELPGSFRLFYDAAITGIVPDASRIAYAAPIAIADVADTHASNIERCRIAYATVEGLQEWVRGQQALNP